jgi:hypothetical protein
MLKSCQLQSQKKDVYCVDLTTININLFIYLFISRMKCMQLTLLVHSSATRIEARYAANYSAQLVRARTVPDKI